MSLTFEIKGMHCKSCKMLIEDILEDLSVSIVSLQVNEEQEVGKLEVEKGQEPQKIINAIQEEGDYKVKQI